MAGGTSCVGKTKPDRHNARNLRARMAALTERGAVRTAKREPCARMVELGHVPALHIVTALTTIAGDALVELICMRIGMACKTFKRLPSELVFP